MVGLLLAGVFMGLVLSGRATEQPDLIARAPSTRLRAAEQVAAPADRAPSGGAPWPPRRRRS